jgi:hypothetical protein
MRYMVMICQGESTLKDAEEMRSGPEGFAWFEEIDRPGAAAGRAPRPQTRKTRRTDVYLWPYRSSS